MKDRLTGWKDVYVFTLTQKVKGRGFRIFSLILLILAIASMPLITKISKEKVTTSIEEVYIVGSIPGIDTQQFINSLSNISSEDKLYSHLHYVSDNSSYEDIKKEIKEAGKDYHKILASVDYAGTSTSLQLLYGKNTAVSESDVNNYSAFLNQHLKDVFIDSMNISKEQISYINAPITTDVLIKSADSTNVNDTGKDAANNDFSMNLYILGCIIFGICAVVLSVNSEAIATSIITEKSSRVIEYLMISIRPMAVVMGKVLAMLSIVFIDLAIVAIGIAISILQNPTGVPMVVRNFFTGLDIGNISPVKIVLAILIFLTGLLLFSVFAALFGATVSKIEEAGETSKFHTVLTLIGIYMSIALILMQMSGVDAGVYKMVVFILPFSSFIALPFYLLVGRAGILIAVISFIVLLICLVFLVLFVSRVYGYVLYHSGSKIRIKDLFRISSDMKGGK